MKMYVLSGLMAVCLCCLSCERIPGGTENHSFRAEKGMMDLRNVDFSRGPIINLRGGWEFYWSRLVDPGEFKKAVPVTMTGHLDLPGLWNGYRADGKTLGGAGYATFRLLVRVPPGERLYGIKITEMESAYRLWVNGRLVAETGMVGTAAASAKPSWKRVEAYFHENAPVLDLVLHMSNFSHRKGGPEEVIKFGPGESVARYKSLRYGIELFLVGSILLMGIYHLIIFLLRRTEKSALYFSLLCFSVSLRTLLSGEKIFLDVFPGIDWGFHVAMEYLVLFVVMTAFTLFFYSMFREEMSRWVVRVVTGIALIFGIIVLLSKPVFFTNLAIPYQVVLLSVGLYTIGATVVAVYRGKPGALVYLAGVVLLFITAVSDVMYNTLLIDTSLLMPVSTAMGLFVFILSQSVILAMYYSRAFSTIEDLSRDLEQKVDERTADLQTERNKLAKMAIEDELTGLYNRRYSLEYLKSEFYRFSRYGAIFSVLVLDLDHFKKVNDTYGHLEGDVVLRQIGSVLKEIMRMSDVCGRFGGEEFIVILPETKRDPAGALAEKIRSRVESLEFRAGDSGYTVNCSIGVAQVLNSDGEYNVLLQRADTALYAAKDQGRNRVVCLD